jgi:hypothetical protein
MIVLGWIPSISQPHFWFRKDVWNSKNSISGISLGSGQLRRRRILAGKELSENAPIFMVKLASNTKSAGGDHHREEEESYPVMLASILLLEASRNTADRFAYMLGLYLHASGVKCRVREVLDGLGVTEGYHTLANSKEALSTRSTVWNRSLRIVAAPANVYGRTTIEYYQINGPLQRYHGLL